MNCYNVTIATGPAKGQTRSVWAATKRDAMLSIIDQFPVNKKPMATAEQVKFQVGDTMPVA